MQRWKQEVIQGAGLGAIAVWMGACLVTPIDNTTETESESESESTSEDDDDDDGDTKTNPSTHPTTNPTEIDSETGAGTTGTGTTGPVDTDTDTDPSAGGICGDGSLDRDEACDDGVNDGSYGGCMPDCLSPGPNCGDGTPDEGNEVCDDGVNDGAYGGCNSDCQALGPNCGDGAVEDGQEECDDGNDVAEDDCNACAAPFCGDSVTHAGIEVCDDGTNDGSYGGCSADCTAKGPFCGDLNLDAEFETCDDGNGENQDGCLGDCSVPESCKQILEFAADSADGAYVLTAADTTWSTYCDMTTDGGGWTLAAKVASTNTWRYTNAIWTNANLLSGDKAGFDHTPAKLATWNAVPFTQIHLGMEANGNAGAPAPTYVVLDVVAESLFALFSPGTETPTAATKTAWLPLMPDASLQEGCDKEGANITATADPASPRVRLGILSDDSPDCSSPSSVLGLGFDNLASNCMNAPFTSGGNLNCAAVPFTKKSGFGWIFVR